MDAADLKVFEAVARLGSMGRAAEVLHTVQSNVTTRIRQLEDELGTTLFRRHARGVEPTRAGQRLLPYALQVARLLVEARHATLDEGTPSGPLIIGSLETTIALHLTELLSTFAADHREVDLTLQTGTTCELLDQVLDHRLEGAFVCGPVAHPELKAERVFVEELVLLTAAPVGSLGALAERGDLRIVVLRRGCSYRQRLEDMLARHGVPAPRILEFGTLEAIFGCVAAGLGVTLLPRALIGPVWLERRIAIHALPPRDGFVETVFVRRHDSYVSSALTAFLAAVPGYPAVKGKPIAAE
jgi:LysR family transcriptional regulator, cell division regulator